MAVAVVVVAGLILCGTLKTVADDEAQCHEEPQCVVQRGSTHRKPVFSIQFVAQFVEREMPIDAIYCIEYGKALWRLSQIVLFQVTGKDIPHRNSYVFFHFMWLKTAQNYEIFFRYRQK